MGLEEQSDMIFACSSLRFASCRLEPAFRALINAWPVAGMLFMSSRDHDLFAWWGLPLYGAGCPGWRLWRRPGVTLGDFTDTIEWDELQTGQRHEGMFYSLVTLFRKIAASLSIPLLLLMLSWTSYVPNASSQPPSAILGIRLLTGPYPAALLLVGVVFASRYPLTRQRFAQVRQELAERRKAAGGT
jgi:hypothetical protein